MSPKPYTLNLQKHRAGECSVVWVQGLCHSGIPLCLWRLTYFSDEMLCATPKRGHIVIARSPKTPKHSLYGRQESVTQTPVFSIRHTLGFRVGGLGLRHIDPLSAVLQGFGWGFHVTGGG